MEYGMLVREAWRTTRQHRFLWILGLFAGTVVGMALFAWIELHQVQPLMQLSLFRTRSYSLTNLVALILSFGMMGVFFLLPIFLQAILGYSAIKAGLVMTPLAAIVIVSAPVAGTLSDRIGAKWPIFVGMLVTALGFYLTRRVVVTDGSWSDLVLPFIISGFGIGMVMPPMTSAAMGSVPPEKAGQASGVISSFRQIGSVLGIAVMGAVLQSRAVSYIQDGVSAKLAAVPFSLPDTVKQQIVDAVGSSAVNMGQMRAGGGIGAAMPDGIAQMMEQVPASMAGQVSEFFSNLFSMDFIMGEFAHAMRTTYLFSIILLVVGAALALGIVGRKPRARK